MNQFHNAMEMLDLIMAPAFCVRNGKIEKVNSAAAALMIETGTQIQSLLQSCEEEYAAFRSGCLYLMLNIGEQEIGVSVTRIQDFDVFCAEQDTDSHMQALSLAARELRASLSSLMTVADKVFPDAAGSDPQTQELLSHMNRSLFQMLRILNNMSDAQQYAMLADARQEVRDITAVVEEIFHRAEALTAHTAVTLRYTGPSERIFTLLDEQKLERMIFNILSNSIKFTPNGGTIDATLTRRGRKLYLSICDNGSGLSDSVRNNLFSRYLREPGLEDRRNGLGLGMVLIRSTAALHGGTVLVEQPEGCGTRVTVSLSIRQGDPAVRSPRIRIDYTGERDHGLVELSDVLPALLYDPDSIN